MHPAWSLIAFTTAAGAGYGLLFMLALSGLLSAVPVPQSLMLVGIALALALITGGLLASTLHLGHPERAWRALTQWRTSWLSREGVLALATYVPALALGWRLWSGPARDLWFDAAALALVLLCPATVYATAMIYASLKTVAAWCTPRVPINFLLLALLGGCLLLNALKVWWDFKYGPPATATVAVILGAAALKLAYWRHLDRRLPASSAESATGLGRFGRVSALIAPHTEENYLLQEMGFRIARKHARRLRRLAFLCCYVLPLLLSLAALALPGAGAKAAATLCVAVAALGLLIERWLFFAEAKHTVTLYYGRQAV